MSRRIPVWWTPLFIAIGVLLIYGSYLGYAPIYLCHDEVVYSLHAHSMAAGGRDLNGRLLPLYFHVNDNFWAMPVLIYVQAALLTVLPFSEWAVRFPSALVGALNVVLMYFIAKRIFGRERPALLASAMLALTPAHFLHSRLGVDHLYPLPFMMGWLLCLLIYLERPQLRLLFIGTALLGGGVYTYLAAVIMMPVYLALTWLVLLHHHKQIGRPHAVSALGFIVPLVVLVPWVATHPEQYGQQLRMYNLADGSSVGFVQSLKPFFSHPGLTMRSQVYYEFFNPSFLFFSSDSSLINSTRTAGVFLLPFAIFLPLGVNQIVNFKRTPVNLLLLAGLFSAPLAALLVNEVKINRALVMLPYAALIATFGAEVLLAASSRWRRAAIVALVLMPIQFAVFGADYFTGYRVRSSVWFERNFRGAVEDVIARDAREPVPAVYLSRSIPWIDWYWRWYLVKYHREDLAAKTVYFDPKTLDSRGVPERSVIVGYADAPTGSARNVTLIPEPDGTPSFEVSER